MTVGNREVSVCVGHSKKKLNKKRKQVGSSFYQMIVACVNEPSDGLRIVPMRVAMIVLNRMFRTVVRGNRN